MKPCLLLLLVAATCAACRETRDERGARSPLYHASTAFQVPVTSVGLSIAGDSILYLGFENGNVVIKNTRADEQIAFSAGYNRVYDVRETGDGALLVGMRDEGLKLVRADSLGQWRVEKSYPIEGKGTHYGVYSIARDERGGDFVLGTSNGCYLLSPGDDAPRPYAGSTSSIAYLPFNKVACSGGEVYMASGSGLSRGGRAANGEYETWNTLLPGNVITDIFPEEERVYIAARDSGVWVLRAGERRAEKIWEPGFAVYAFVKDAEGAAWAIGNDRIAYRPADGSATVTRVIPGGVNVSGKQVARASKNFVYLTSENRLLAFPARQNTDGERGNILAAGATRDGKIAYALGGDYTLYSYNKGHSLVRVRGKVDGLEIRDNVIQGEVRGNDFWVATDKILFRVDAAACRLAGRFPVNAPGESRDDIRCFFFANDTTLYVGTRLGLRAMHPGKDDRMHPAGFLEDDDLYATALLTFEGRLLVGTLNKGLFAINADGTVDTLLGGDYPPGNIRGLIEEEGRLYLHASDRLYRYEGPGRVEATRAGGKEIRAIASAGERGAVVMGYHGFARTRSLSRHEPTALSYRDVTLGNASLAFLDASLLLIGTRSGMYLHDGKQLSHLPVEAPETITRGGRLAGLLSALCVLLLAVSVAWDQRTQRRRLRDFARRTSRTLGIIEKQVPDKQTREELQHRAAKISGEIARRLRGAIPPRATDHLSNAMYRLEQETHENAISLEETRQLEQEMQQLHRHLEEERRAAPAIQRFMEGVKRDFEAIAIPKHSLTLVKERKEIIRDIDKLRAGEISNGEIESMLEKIETIQKTALLFKQKVSKEERLERAMLMNLDETDLEILEVLATPNHPRHAYYAKHAKMVEKRQKKIVEQFGRITNKRRYIVAAAFRKGLLSI
ncbi:MAG: hypothetical protein LBD64_06295 [Odoribacteraceae bacterium]|nr:hypothetical protein [Odoribacteraceae bacterium]